MCLIETLKDQRRSTLKDSEVNFDKFYIRKSKSNVQHICMQVYIFEEIK